MSELSYVVRGEFDLLEFARDRVAQKMKEETDAAFEIALAEVGFVRKRTCSAVLSERRDMVTCSECGSTDLLKDWSVFCDFEGNLRIESFTTHDYCPSCGAEVVDHARVDADGPVPA